MAGATGRRMGCVSRGHTRRGHLRPPSPPRRAVISPEARRSTGRRRPGDRWSFTHGGGRCGPRSGRSQAPARPREPGPSRLPPPEARRPPGPGLAPRSANGSSGTLRDSVRGEDALRDVFGAMRATGAGEPAAKRTDLRAAARGGRDGPAHGREHDVVPPGDHVDAAVGFESLRSSGSVRAHRSTRDAPPLGGSLVQRVDCGRFWWGRRRPDAQQSPAQTSKYQQIPAPTSKYQQIPASGRRVAGRALAFLGHARASRWRPLRSRGPAPSKETRQELREHSGRGGRKGYHDGPKRPETEAPAPSDEGGGRDRRAGARGSARARGPGPPSAREPPSSRVRHTRSGRSFAPWSAA